MAETPLTDSIEALTTYANQVTGASDTNLSDAVYTLAQGYGGGGGINLLPYVSSIQGLFQDCVGPENVVLDFTGNETIANISSVGFRGTGVKHLTIKNLNSAKTTFTMAAFAYLWADIETITFENCSFSSVSLESFCRSANKLTSIIGEIDCTNTNNINFCFGNAIVDFRIKRNTLSKSSTAATWGGNGWSNASFVSLANGFNPTAAGTFKMSATQLAKCATIIGTVTDGLFVEDASGSVTLSDFIANTKGWTLTT